MKTSSDPRYALQGVGLAGLTANHKAAFDRLMALLRQQPDASDAWSQLPAAARACGRGPEAIAECIRAYDADPMRNFALAALLHLIPDDPGAERAVAAEKDARSSISVIVCSNDDTQFQAMAESYRRALESWSHEIIRIADASSLAEGYTRGMAAASGEIVIFSHDDVELLPADLGARLVRHLDRCDLLGIAGATRATGPAWAYAGYPFLRGTVIYPEGRGYRVLVYGRSVPLAQGIRVMDGVFLAMRREVALSVGWDAETCDGFHGYDIDFTLRAVNAGFKLGVASNLGLVHRSYGGFDERWAAAAKKLAARHPELNGSRGQLLPPAARSVPSAAHAMALIDNWSRQSL